MMWLTGRALLAVVILLAAATSLWAAEGWYLLVPPRSEYNERADYLKGYEILGNKPLSRWTQQGAYDSASECEAVRNTLKRVDENIFSKASDEYRKALGEGKDPAVLKFQRYIVENDYANSLVLGVSRCIASDDPRLQH